MFSNRTLAFSRDPKLCASTVMIEAAELIDNEQAFAQLQADVADTRFAAAIRGRVGPLLGAKRVSDEAGASASARRRRQ
jgi:hypothetical protein